MRNKSLRSIEEFPTKKDFEIRKAGISAVSLKSPYVTRRMLVGDKTSIEGYIAITPKDYTRGEMLVHTLGSEQFHQIVRLIAAFRRGESEIRLFES